MKTRVLRMALLSGVVMFGAVAWYLRKNGSAPEPTADPRTLLIAGRVIWAVALVGCALIFLRLRQETSAGRVRTFSVISWALGELTALYGGVVYLLAGNPLFYQLGVGYMVLTFLAFPGDASP